MRNTICIALLVFGATIAAQAQAPAPSETLSQTFRGSRGRDVEYQKIPPFKALDNVFHVGPGSVSVWLIPTTAGLILVDTAQEPYVDHILNNIRNLGYDPKDIRYILLTQGHLDHFGGAARIQELSGARVAAAEGDWVLMDEYAKRPAPAMPPFHRTVDRDIVLRDGDTVTLGNTSLKVYLLPGHTPGGASFEFTAYDRGRPYKAMLFGGPEPRGGIEGAQQFLASVSRLATIPDVSVGLLVHSWLAMSTYPNGGTFERMAQLQLRRGDMPNPFVDPASWRGWMDRLKMVSQKFLSDEQAKVSSAPAPPRGGGPGPVRFPTPAQFTASAEAQRIVADARKHAGTDLQWHYTNVCSSMGPQRVALALQAAGQTLKDYTVEPTKVFDNMWYVGLASQGAFVITTSAGLILIDTLNNTDEARDIIVPGMKKAGLDPAQIKYIVLSHGHPGQTDHTGGASWFQATYKPRILMAKEDWDATLPAQRPERPLAKRDMDITHGQTLTLGDTTLTFTTLFGHSDGSLGIFVPVKWRGQSSVVWLHGGGLHHPTRASLARLEDAVNTYARPMGAEALLNTHPGLYQDTIADMEAIRKNPNGPNPILLGRERANRYWSMVLDCARARVIALEDAAKNHAQTVGRMVTDRGPGEWAEFASPDDRFTSNFPGPPTVTPTTWRSEFGAELKGRIYSAARGNGRFQITAIDYSPVESILTARAKACPVGAETCRGGADTGVGYWKNDIRGAIDFAVWKLLQRPGVKVTYFVWGFQDMVAGKLLHLTNPDGTRTFASMYFHDNRLIVMEGTVPEAEPEPGLFQQSLGWLDDTGRGIRYATVYYADPDLPKPPLHQRSFISDFGRIDATGIR